MPYSDLLRGTLILLGAALGAAWLLRLLRAPSVLGFLFAGLLIGPSGLNLIHAEQVESLAELGLVLLLFTIGLELSPRPLFRAGRSLLIASLLQFGITALLAGGVVLAGRVAFAPAVVIGAAVALSSTAIVLKQIHERGEARTAAGMIATGILLLQDIFVIAVMLGLPAFASTVKGDWTGPMLHTALGLAVLAGVVTVARFVLPLVLRYVIRPGGREFLALFAVVMACGGAWLAGELGWTLALGSCIAGLVLAGTDVRHQLLADITPFRDVFNALFFISLGMLVNIPAVQGHLPWILAAIVLTVIAKSALTAVAVVAAGWPLRLGLQVGISLCTVSEFGYVLGREAVDLNLLEAGLLQDFVAYAVGTMMLGSLLLPLASPVAHRLSRSKEAPEAPAGGHGEGEEAEQLFQHVIIVGYGVNGHNLARVLRATRIPHCVIEMSPGLVEQARQAGERTIVGDATRLPILRHAGVETAGALVVAINDPAATQRIVSQVVNTRPDLYVLARTSYVSELDTLYSLGAQEVISEDFETSIEIAAHVLKRFGIPDNIIDAQVAAIRAGRYAMLRGKPADRIAQAELMKALETTVTLTFYIEEGYYACGRTLGELHVRAKTGVTVIAVVRRGKPQTNPTADFRFDMGDILVLVGSHEQLDKAKLLLARSLETAS